MNNNISLRCMALTTITEDFDATRKWIAEDGRTNAERAKDALYQILERITDKDLRSDVEEAVNTFHSELQLWAVEFGIRRGARMMMDILKSDTDETIII